MSFAFLPIYTGDYRRKTGHLSPLKHGIYLLLLMHCWDTKGPAPLDEQECSGIANCRSTDEIEALRYILLRFFVKMEDGHYNKRIQIEIERAEAISRARSDAGKRGYEALAKQLRGKSRANAGHLPITPTPTLTLTPTPIENQKDIVGLTPDPSPEKAVSKGLQTKTNNAAAVALLTFLNEKTGSKYQPVQANVKLIVGRLQEGFTEKQIRQVIANRCLAWADDPKMDEYLRPKTLFNATNFANYAGQLGKVTPEAAHDPT